MDSDPKMDPNPDQAKNLRIHRSKTLKILPLNDAKLTQIKILGLSEAKLSLFFHW